MAIESVARRYVRALLAVAMERGEEDAALEALRGLQRLWGSLPELRHAMGNPQIPSDRRLAVLLRLLGSAAPECVRQFMRVLVRHSRVDVLRYAGDLMALALDEARGVRHATVTSAMALTGAQRQAVAEALREALQCEIILETRVEPAMIGGVAVRVGDLVVDGSIRQRLESMRRHLERERELRAQGVEG